MEKEEKLDRLYTQRWKPVKEGDRGSDNRIKTKGKKTIGYTLYEFLKEQLYAELKREAKKRKEWGT